MFPDPAPGQVNPGFAFAGRDPAKLLLVRACGPAALPLSGRDGGVLVVTLEPGFHHRQRAPLQRERPPRATFGNLVERVQPWYVNGEANSRNTEGTLNT